MANGCRASGRLFQFPPWHMLQVLRNTFEKLAHAPTSPPPQAHKGVTQVRQRNCAFWCVECVGKGKKMFSPSRLPTMTRRSRNCGVL